MELNQTSTVMQQNTQNEEAEEGSKDVKVVDFKMVTFSLAGKDYAIDIMKVKEIVKAGRFTYVPNTLPFVLGVYNLRGEIIPIVDLRLFFNIDVPDREDNTIQNVLIVNVGDQIFGIVVDAINTVVGIEKKTIQPPHPLFGDISIKYIYGVVECNDRLFILLDVDKIFTVKAADKEKKTDLTPKVIANPAMPIENIPVQSQRTEVSKGQKQTKVAEEAKPVEQAPVDNSEKFIIEELKELKHFFVSSLNDTWAQSRFTSWAEERKGKTSQLQNEEDADAFLKQFWSRNSDTFWDKAYADEVYQLLPENSAKQIVVWNPGCGKGCESFSLACLLKKRYPSSKIRIYAHDINLLSVSNAPLISVPASYAEDWYAPYVLKKANGEYGFTQEIKDIIMFEYHDCMNSNALPMIDMVFARDILSLLPVETQNAIVSEFDEKLKGNGIVVLGDHEILSNASWKESNVGSVSYYTK